MNVNKVLTKDYINKTVGERGKNEPKTNPIKANLLKAKMNVNKVITKDYENLSNWAICENKPNSKPIQTQSNPISKAKNCSAEQSQSKPSETTADKKFAFLWDFQQDSGQLFAIGLGLLFSTTIAAGFAVGPVRSPERTSGTARI